MHFPKIDTTKLKEQAEQNPLVVLGLGAALMQGAAKLMNANTGRKNAKTWKREVVRREKSTKKSSK